MSAKIRQIPRETRFTSLKPLPTRNVSRLRSRDDFGLRT